MRQMKLVKAQGNQLVTQCDHLVINTHHGKKNTEFKISAMNCIQYPVDR